MRYAPFVFLVTLALCLCLAVALVTLVNTDNSDVDQKKIRVGVVGEFENSYLGFGISALQSFDSSRFSLEIVELSSDEARESLLDGELTGYVVIPEGFVEDAIYGDVGKLMFVTTNSNADIITMFKQEVLELISCLLVESQNGVYGMQDIMFEYDYERDVIMDNTNELVAEYVGVILNRSNAFELEVTGISENLTFGGYMISGLSVLLMLLSGIVCCSLFVRRDMALPKLMSANRYRPSLQIVGEYIAYFFVMLANTLVLLFLMMQAAKHSGAVLELAGVGTGEILLILVKFIPAIAMISAFQFFLYQLADSIVSGVLMQFVSAVFLGYISGCFYPISFFPKAVRAVAGVIPSGIARGYLSSLLTDTAGVVHILPIAGYVIVLVALSVLVRRHRIKTA